MMEDFTTTPTTSPRWNGVTKLVVALTLVAIVAGLLIKFESVLPPLILVIILAYLLSPVAAFLARKLHISWQLAVSLIYIAMIIILLAALTLGGLGLVQQVQSLIGLIQEGLLNLPALLTDISGRVVTIGPFTLDLRTIDLSVFGNQLLGTVQPLIGQSGNLVGAIAGGAANFLGWAVFVLLVSYFLLAESGGIERGFLQVDIPGYSIDIARMRRELANIWNAFLRGQILLMGVATVIYTIVLSVLGVNYAFGLAVMAGLARFLPYIGSFTVWTTLFMVTLFQVFKPFGLDPLIYALLVVGLAWLVDMILDNFVAPRMMADTLKVHPAAVLVAALVALNLLGILGLIIAAPLLATFQLLGRYFTRKLFDLDPWEGMDDPYERSNRRQLLEWLAALRRKLNLGPKPRPDNESPV